MARIHQMTITEFERSFPHEEACSAYLVKHRWPNGVVVCPRCGLSEKVRAVSTMSFKWQCYSCNPNGYRFSEIAGTIFENTNKPLREWFRVIHMMLTSKKGVSALQVQRVMGFGSYRTAWYMCHRVRAGLADEKFRKLMGIVEADETCIGGSWKNKHVRIRKARAKKGGAVGKVIVAGAVERGGNVVARVIQSAPETGERRVVSYMPDPATNLPVLHTEGPWTRLPDGPELTADDRARRDADMARMGTYEED